MRAPSSRQPAVIGARLRGSRCVHLLATADLHGLLFILVGVLVLATVPAGLLPYGWLIGLAGPALAVALVVARRWARAHLLADKRGAG